MRSLPDPDFEKDVMTFVLLFLAAWALMVGVLVWALRRYGGPVPLSLGGEPAMDDEIRRQLLTELESRFRRRFPGREYTTDPEEFLLDVPNENGLEGVAVVVDHPEEVMVMTGEFIHWHLDREFTSAKTEGDARSTALDLVDRVLDLLGDIIEDRLCFYSIEGRLGLTSGSYEVGDRPRNLKPSNELTAEWMWSRNLSG